MYYVIEAQNAKTSETFITISDRPAVAFGKDEYHNCHVGRAYGWNVYSHDGYSSLHGAETAVKIKWPRAQRAPVLEPHSPPLCAFGRFAGGEFFFTYKSDSEVIKR